MKYVVVCIGYKHSLFSVQSKDLCMFAVCVLHFCAIFLSFMCVSDDFDVLNLWYFLLAVTAVFFSIIICDVGLTYSVL